MSNIWNEKGHDIIISPDDAQYIDTKTSWIVNVGIILQKLSIFHPDLSWLLNHHHCSIDSEHQTDGEASYCQGFHDTSCQSWILLHAMTMTTLMDWQSSARKTVTLPSGRKYTYLYIPTASHSLDQPTPTILFLHGFPSSSYDWRHQIAYFSSHGRRGVLVPDLLGYGLSDKPSGMEAYRGKTMAADIAGLLDHEHLTQVHGVAHDMGAFLLSRCAVYYAEHFASYTFLVNAYMPPAIPFDVDAMNAMTKAKYGYDVRGYYKFFARADAGAIIAEHVCQQLTFYGWKFCSRETLLSLFSSDTHHVVFDRRLYLYECRYSKSDLS